MYHCMYVKIKSCMEKPKITIIHYALYHHHTILFHTLCYATITPADYAALMLTLGTYLNFFFDLKLLINLWQLSVLFCDLH